MEFSREQTKVMFTFSFLPKRIVCILKVKLQRLPLIFIFILVLLLFLAVTKMETLKDKAGDFQVLGLYPKSYLIPVCVVQKLFNM